MPNESGTSFDLWCTASLATRPSLPPYHPLAGLLIALAFGVAIGITANLDWPADPDHFRDIAAAQTIKSGAVLSDPFYVEERIWYNPLVPTLLAAFAVLTDSPIHIVETRAGAYLNLVGALSFYWLATLLASRRAAVGALATFLFLQPFPSWQTATYSPWLFVSNFAQGLFYITLGLWIKYQERPTRVKSLLVGVSLGFTFLAHTAPAVLLGVLLLTGTLRRLRKAGWRWRDAQAAHIAWAIGVACLIAAPFLYSILWHYRGRILNPLPIVWLDPAMLPPHIGPFLYATVGPSFINVVAALGLASVAIRYRNELARFTIVVWMLASAALFTYSAYLWRVSDSAALAPLAIVPAHHFLVYFRAAIAMLFGVGFDTAVKGVGRVARAVPSRRWPLPSGPGASSALLLLIVALHFPAFLRREDNAWSADRAAGAFADNDQRLVFDWIATETPRNAVFLAPQNASLSMVAAAGRKVVIVDRFFSNPYVDWSRRYSASEQMWASLAVGDCRTFAGYATALQVTHVMTIHAVTPDVPAGRCGMEMAYRAGDFTVLQRIGG